MADRKGKKWAKGMKEAESEKMIEETAKKGAKEKSLEEIIKDKREELHSWMDALDEWNRYIARLFGEYARGREGFEEFHQTLRRKMLDYGMDKEIIYAWEGVRESTDIGKIIGILRAGREWILERIDSVIESACLLCAGERTVEEEKAERKRRWEEIAKVEEEIRRREEGIEEEEVEEEEEEEKEEEMVEGPPIGKKAVEEKVVEERKVEEKVAEVSDLHKKALELLTSIKTQEDAERVFHELGQGDLYKYRMRMGSESVKETPEEAYDVVKKAITDVHYKLVKSVDLKEVFPEIFRIEDQLYRFLAGEVIVAEKRVVSFEVEEDYDKGIVNAYLVVIKPEGDKVKEHHVVITSTPEGNTEECDCEDYKYRHVRCKHIYASMISMLIEGYWKEAGEEIE